MHIHDLKGCATIPLAWYLKALGILRLVSEQADSSARGWWRNECFHLATILNRDELIDFFLNEYEPTPILSPWNGGSGFYPNDNKIGIDAILTSTEARFDPYRTAIEKIKKILEDMGLSELRNVIKQKKDIQNKNKKTLSKSEAKEINKEISKEIKLITSQIADLKTSIFGRCYGELSAWMDAAVVITSDGTPKYPALLGTGGNDGRLDFTNNFMKRIKELLLDEENEFHSKALLGVSLFNAPAPRLEKNKAIGQFSPGHVGGANATNGYEDDSYSNSWDFILMLEGAVAFVSGVSRRNAPGSMPRAAAPFAVHPASAGFGTASSSETNSRGEQWMPVWSRPLSYPELSKMLSEGRSKIGKSESRRPLDFSRAIARYGVARGIDSFERYGYLERNGQANIATPLGRWLVKPQPNQQLLDDLVGWLDSCRRAASKLSASFQSNVRSCEEAAMRCTQNGASPAAWLNLLETVADMELKIASANRSTVEKHLRPLPRLSTEWIKAAYDGSAEFRLGLSLGSIYGIRKFLLPLDAKYRFDFNNTLNWVCRTGDLRRDLAALVRRAAVLSGREKNASNHGKDDQRLFALRGRVSVSFSDIHELLDELVDGARVMRLARAFTVLRWPKQGDGIDLHNLLPKQPKYEPPDPLYALFKLAHLPFETTKDVAIRVDPAVIERLLSGDLSTAFKLALQRLRAAGLKPKLTEVAGDPQLARNLATAVAFPVSKWSVKRMADRVCKPYRVEIEEPI